MWSILALGTAVFFALNGWWSARVSRRIGALLGAWALFTFALPVLGVYLLARGIPEVGSAFWVPWSVSVLGNVGASYLLFSSLRSGDLGITYPLLALSPAFIVPTEWILLGELPAPSGFVGIGLVVLGAYFLNARTAHRGILAPLAALARDRSAVQALAVAVLWSVLGTIDRVAVLASSGAFYGFMLSAGVALLFVPLVLLTGRGDRGPAPGLASRLAGCPPAMLFVHGLFFACMLVLQMEALDLQLASYVLSIKRVGTVIAVLIGYFAFREGGLGPRLIGTTITLLGVSILVLSG